MNESERDVAMMMNGMKFVAEHPEHAQQLLGFAGAAVGYAAKHDMGVTLVSLGIEHAGVTPMVGIITFPKAMTGDDVATLDYAIANLTRQRDAIRAKQAAAGN